MQRRITQKGLLHICGLPTGFREWLIAFETPKKLKLRTRHLVFRSIWYRIRQHVSPLLASWRQRKPPESIALQWIRAVHLLHDSSISDTDDRRFRFYFVVMYYFHPRRLAKSSIAKQNASHCVNAVCNGSSLRTPAIVFSAVILEVKFTRLAGSKPLFKNE